MAEGKEGGVWLITYCDMITLLVVCFILLTTLFQQKQQANQFSATGSIFEGFAQATVGKTQRLNKDAVGWRLLPLKARETPTGARTPPSNEELAQAAGDAVNQLEKAPPGDLDDSFVLKFNLKNFFDDQGRLTSSGTSQLQFIARNLGPLPFDVLIQVEDAANLPSAVRLAESLGAVFIASRIAVSPQYLNALRLQEVPETVLAKLQKMSGRDFPTEQAFEEELKKILSPAEMAQYRARLVHPIAPKKGVHPGRVGVGVVGGGKPGNNVVRLTLVRQTEGELP